MIDVNESNGIPIYQQIYDGFIRLIVMKVLNSGDKLPSVRELALQININPNTIQKAYKSLEGDGFIYSVKGKGNFVGEYESVVKKFRSHIDVMIKDSVHKLLIIGDTEEVILNHVSTIVKEYKNDRD